MYYFPINKWVPLQPVYTVSAQGFPTPSIYYCIESSAAKLSCCSRSKDGTFAHPRSLPQYKLKVQADVIPQ